MEGEAETPAQQSSPSMKSSNNTLKIVGAVIVVAVLAFLVWEFGLKGKTNNSMQATPTPSESGAMQEQPSTSYKDGTYTATGAYQNPASREEMEVTITLANGVVTAADFKGTPDNPTTTTMQGRLKDGFDTEVIGKPIDEINLTVVNGSSLSPKGFMDALNQIKTQAQG